MRPAGLPAAAGPAERVESLRTALREYLAALDRGDDLAASLIARCTLGPAGATGRRRVTLAVPLVPLAPVLPRRVAMGRHLPDQGVNSPFR